MNNFRYPGEFEKQDLVIICWPKNEYSVKDYNVHNVFMEIIKHVITQVEVIINCGEKDSLQDCRQKLQIANIDMSKIKFTQFKDYMCWARDYGPDILIDDKGNKRLINFNFNTYQEETEHCEISLCCKKIAPHMAIELDCFDIVSTNLISEGGNKEFNGNGVLITIEDTEVTKRNPQYTKLQIENEFKKLFNLKKVIWLEKPSFDDENRFTGILDVVNGVNVYRSASANGHIDEICRFIDQNTILLADISHEEASKSTSAKITKERLDNAYAILKNDTNVDGNPFNIVRVPSPEPVYFTVNQNDAFYHSWCRLWKDQQKQGLMGDKLLDGSEFPKGDITMQPALSYCNFLILNDIVLGQHYYEDGMPIAIKQKDEQAKKVLERLFPHKKVITINTTALNILGGGIHCVTKNISYS